MGRFLRSHFYLVRFTWFGFVAIAVTYVPFVRYYTLPIVLHLYICDLVYLPAGLPPVVTFVTALLLYVRSHRHYYHA